jgi:hypothetical protein
MSIDQRILTKGQKKSRSGPRLLSRQVAERDATARQGDEDKRFPDLPISGEFSESRHMRQRATTATGRLFGLGMT